MRSAKGVATIWLVIMLGAVVALAAVFVVTAIATDRPGFCPTCHSMRPYYDAWAAGPHEDRWCIDCHVGAGLPSRFAHKFVALKEVVAQVRGDDAFPRPKPSEVPDARCLRCHADPGPKDPPRGFSHDKHRTYGPCQLCHPNVGHNVTDAALKQAGVFSAPNAARRAARSQIPSGAVAAPEAGAANLPGHTAVVCSRCHNMRATGCSSCHARPKEDHPANDECGLCHRFGPGWAFAHPNRSNCISCHKAPANHFGSACASCHRPSVPFERATFRHPSNIGEHSFRSFACSKCHPSGPPKVSCTCHGGGFFTEDGNGD